MIILCLKLLSILLIILYQLTKFLKPLTIIIITSFQWPEFLRGIAKKKNNFLLISPGPLLTILQQLTKIEATCYTTFRDMCGSRGGTGGPDPPPGKLQKYRVP